MITWADFKTAVVEELNFSKDREKYQAYIARQVRFAALDLQREVDEYRIGHTRRYDSRTITAKGQAGVIDLPEGVQVDAVYLEPERVFESSESMPDAESTRIALSFPDISGAVALTLTVCVRGEAGEVGRLSTDTGNSASFTIKETGAWEFHTVVLNIADADACEFIYLGYGGGEYCTIDWSEIHLSSGDFTQVAYFGEGEEGRLYTTKKLKWYPWDRRSELVAGCPSGSAPGFYAENKRYLWAHLCDQAAIDAGAVITIVATGRKLDFEDADETAFDEYAINAASLYVRYKLLKHIDQFSEGWKVQQDYERERALIIADKNAN